MTPAQAAVIDEARWLVATYAYPGARTAWQHTYAGLVATVRELEAADGPAEGSDG